MRLLLAFLLGPASALVCKICRHQGLSMVPPSAPRSRFIFNAPQPACVEDDVTCAPNEEYCLSAYGYCNLFQQRQGCTEQMLDLSAARSLPLPNPESPLSLTVCVCNEGDFCNAGLLARDDPPRGGAQRLAGGLLLGFMFWLL